jgi:predicted ArsR family transcriptional regulator
VKPPTRLRILDHIRKHQTASVGELGRVLGMTGANIRHHLAVLESNDLVEVVGRRQEGRGRPLGVYGLSRRMLGDGLDELAGVLLEVWLNGAKDEVRESGLRAVAQRLIVNNTPHQDISITQRVGQAVNRLNELHYQARWEASAAGPRLILGNCPFSAIIASHPELCQMDSYLLEAQLDLPVDQTEKLKRSTKGLPFCSFLVGE